jgi:hypothetical protein
MHVEPSRITFRMWGCGWQGAKLNDCTVFALRTPFLRFARRHSAGNDVSAASKHSCNCADSDIKCWGADPSIPAGGG